mmetsp:Transcript_41213/g.62457  ORF Transcript_41213/g.62457 Transcript_41213/m.62457 type:complete len:263 (+) Transcript_41213:259-1047(+)
MMRHKNNDKLSNNSHNHDMTTYFLSGFHKTNLLTIVPLVLFSRLASSTNSTNVTIAGTKQYAILFLLEITTYIMMSTLFHYGVRFKKKMELVIELHVGKIWGMILVLHLLILGSVVVTDGGAGDGEDKEDYKMRRIWYFRVASSMLIACLLHVSSSGGTSKFFSTTNLKKWGNQGETEGDNEKNDENEEEEEVHKVTLIQTSKLYLFGCIFACILNVTCFNSTLIQTCTSNGTLTLTSTFFFSSSDWRYRQSISMVDDKCIL